MSESETDNRKSMLAQEYQGTNPNVAYYHNYAPPVYNQYTNSQCSTHTAYGHHSVPHSGFGPQTGHQFSTSGPSIDHYENELQTQSLGTSDSNDQLLFVPSSFVVTSPAGQQPIGRSQLVVGGSSGSLGAQADYHQRLHNQQQQHQQHHLHYGYNQPITYQQQQAETYYSDTYYQPNGVAVSASYYQYPNSAEYSIKYKHHNGQQPSQQHLQQQQQQSQLPHRTFPAIGPAPASESQSIGPAATPYGAANAQSAGDRTGDFFGSSAIAIGQSPDGCSHTNLAPLPLPAIKSISCSQSSSSSAGIVSTPSSVIELESSSSSGHHDQDCRRPILTGLHRHQQQQQHHQQQHQAKHQKQPTPGTSATALPVMFSKDSQAPARSHHARRMHQCGDELASFDVEPARGSTRHMGTGRIVAQFGLAGDGTNKPPATLAGSDTMDAITTRVRQPAPRRPAGHVGGGGGGNISGGHGTVKKITKDGMVIARRKNATREITAILKCWLELNLGNPYPNKCEKGVLSCASSMTGTQVSTWFANARRRMKKEEKLYEYMSCKPSQRLYRGPKASEVRLASAIANRALNKLAEQVGCGAAAQSTASMEPSAVAANANLMVGLRKFVDQLNKLAEEKRKEEQVGSSSIISSSSSCPTVVATSTSSSSSSSLSTTSSLSSLSSSTSSSSSTTASPTPPPTPKVRGPTDMAMARSQQQHQQQPSSTTTNYNHDPSMVL